MAGTLREDLHHPPLSESQGKAPLIELIKALISKRGKIPFKEFMELCLYHPMHGYYAQAEERIGAKGDFYTSPHVHGVFGYCIGKQIREFWHLCQSQDFTLLEVGAGKGLMLLDIMRFFRKEAQEEFHRLNCIVIERNPHLVKVQKTLMRKHKMPGERITWLDSFESLGSSQQVGCVVSNEVADSLPVHRWVMTEGGVKEVFVKVEKENFVEVLDEPSTGALEKYFKDLGLQMPVGTRGEVNLSAMDFMKDVARFLKRGFVLTIDYGAKAEELYSLLRPQGTLRCYYRHYCHEDPYRLIGLQDITSHVDFTALMKAGEEAGLETVGFTTQGRFLLGLGILDHLPKRAVKSPRAMKRFLAIQWLFHPEGMGDTFKVLIQQKGLSSGLHLMGLSFSPSFS